MAKISIVTGWNCSFLIWVPSLQKCAVLDKMLEGTLSKWSTHSPWETRGTKGDEECVGATSLWWWQTAPNSQWLLTTAFTSCLPSLSSPAQPSTRTWLISHVGPQLIQASSQPKVLPLHSNAVWPAVHRPDLICFPWPKSHVLIPDCRWTGTRNRTVCLEGGETRMMNSTNSYHKES